MPDDALKILLNLQSPANRTPGGPNVPQTYTPRIGRNNARSAVLSKFLGIPDDGSTSMEDMESTYGGLQAEAQADSDRAAQAKLDIENAKGMYGLETEQLKGQYAVSAASQAASAAETGRATQREFTAGQNDLNREAITGRQAATQAAGAARTAMTRQSIESGQTAARNEGRARLLDAGKAHVPRPANEGFLSRWLTGPSQSTLDQQESARLRTPAVAPAGGGDADIMSVAQAYAQKFGNLADDQLLSQIVQDQPDATPDDIQQLLGAVHQLRGR